MIRIGTDTDIGMNQNSSDWLGMNSYPILSPGMEMHLMIFRMLVLHGYFHIKQGSNIIFFSVFRCFYSFIL